MSDDETSHLSNLSDGAGCAEIWEHLSEQRAAADTEREDGGHESEGDAGEDDAGDDETVDTAEPTEDASETEAVGVPCP